MDLKSTLQAAEDLHLIDNEDDRAFLTEKFTQISQNHSGPYCPDALKNIIRICAGILLDENNRLKKDYIDLICDYQPWLPGDTELQLFMLPYVLLTYGGDTAVSKTTLKERISATEESADPVVVFVMNISILKHFDTLRGQGIFETDSFPKGFYDSRLQVIFPIDALALTHMREAEIEALKLEEEDILIGKEAPEGISEAYGGIKTMAGFEYIETYVDRKLCEYLRNITPSEYCTLLKENADVHSAIQKLITLNLITPDLSPDDVDSIDEYSFLEKLMPGILDSQAIIDARMLATTVNVHHQNIRQPAALLQHC